MMLSIVSTDASPRSFARSATVVTLITLLSNLGYGVWRHQETIDCRRALAFETIESRLPAVMLAENRLDENAAPEVLSRLEEQESDISYQMDHRSPERARAIRRLHENTVGKFINSPGFGATRMSGWNEYRLRTDDPGPIPQPASPPPPYIPDSDFQSGARVAAVPATPQRDVLQDIHRFGIADFVNPRGFGYREASGRVAGFESHRFSDLPAENHASLEPWQLARVELVSLLKSPEPAVYVSEHLPRMDELRDAPTRKPRAFETVAVARLRDGDDLVTQHEGSQLFVVGSLRAGSQCLDCHPGRRGDLLGAFSYEFRLLPSAVEGD